MAVIGGLPNHSTFLVSYTKAIALFVYSGQVIQGFYCPLFIYQTCDLYPFLGNVDVRGFFLFFVVSMMLLILLIFIVSGPKNLQLQHFHPENQVWVKL